jgi:branched-subunit amino acid ABC-type transport system permease component
VGLISELVPVFISPSFVSLVIYGFMIVVLVVRPQGLFGSAGRFGSAALREV